MRDIFVVTHPQSIHHVEGKVGGWYDTGLTEKGRGDAASIAERLAVLCATVRPELVSSDLLRCAETADIIGERLSLPCRKTPNLRELSYGIAEGRPQQWLDANRHPVDEDNRLDDTGGIERAESRRDIARRIYAEMEVLDRSQTPVQIVVTHGFALTFVIAAWIGMPPGSVGLVSFPASSGSITHLRQDDHWKNRAVLRLADTSHLNPRT